MTRLLMEKYNRVIKRIEAFSEKHQVNTPQLLAVSKTKPIEAINEIAEQGQIAFGENYLQEALTKIALRPDLEWHFIGPIQSNKTKAIAEHFHWVQSVDRLKIAARLNQQRPKHLPPLNILLEINISEEPSKSGFQKNEMLQAANEIMTMPHLKLRGLMAIPARAETLTAQRIPLHEMRILFDGLKEALPNQSIDTLSMGMSNDLEAAIAEGSTLVRVGTDIFGARH